MACGDSRYEQKQKVNKQDGSKRLEWIPAILGMLLVIVLVIIRNTFLVSAAGTERESGDTGGSNALQDDSIYADMEGITCTAITLYFYDDEDRLVRSMRYSHPEYKPEVWHENTETTWQYDGQGRVTLEEVRHPYTDNLVHFQRVYDYSENGYTMTVRYPPESDEDVYTYDEEGKLVESYQTANSSYPWQYIYAYDEQGRRISKTSMFPTYDYMELYDENGEVWGWRRYNAQWHSILQDIEWDDENFTSVEEKYSAQGELMGAWISAYNGEWQQTVGAFCNGEEVPSGKEDYQPYCRLGYWALYRENLLVEELFHERNRNSGNMGFHYKAYDYDDNGNMTLQLTLYYSDMDLDYYTYDDQGRLEKEFHYKYTIAQGWDWWEQPLCDNSVIYIAWDSDPDNIDLVSITHMAADESVINIFEFDENGWIKAQYVPEVDAIQEPYVQAEYPSGLTELTWQKTVQEVAEERRYQDKESESDISGQGGQGTESPEDYQDSEDQGYFLYTVQSGDCLWSIAEKYFGDGMKWPEIYRDNVDVIGEYPGLILPGTRLKLFTESVGEERR